MMPRCAATAYPPTTIRPAKITFNVTINHRRDSVAEAPNAPPTRSDAGTMRDGVGKDSEKQN